MKKNFIAATAIPIFLLISGTTSAFVPGPPRSAATGGKTHQDITEEALDQIYALYGYGPKGIKSYTSAIKAARKSLAYWNAWVDYHEDKDAFSHCDGERLQECSDRVQKRISEGVDALKADNADDARSLIGKSFHTLQDFYSHSNWVELGHGEPNPNMGVGVISGIAAPESNTCIDAPALHFCFAENIITSNLTSGYFGGSSGAPPTGVRKCYHGGSFDTLGRDGINKDSTTCILGVPSILGVPYASIISPHDELHPAAAAVAIKATVQALKDIKSRVTDQEMKNLLGIGPSIGFAIDTTGSMGSVISAVRAQVISIVNSRLGTDEQPSRYILSPFNDPGIGPITITGDISTFKSSVNALFANGGGDCPELSMTGLFAAVAASDNNGVVFLFTDASAKDARLSGLVYGLAERKRVAIYPSIFGSCSPYDPAYFQLAERTGGQVFILNRTEAGAVTQLAGLLAKSNTVNILSIAGALSSTPVEHVFPVDSTTNSITISASINGSASVAITRPDGSVVQKTDPGVTVVPLAAALVYSIKTPVVGNWRITASGSGTYSANVNGESVLSFDDFEFVALGGRPGHTGYYEITGRPVVGTPQTALANISGKPLTVQFEFRTRSGALIHGFTLPVNDPDNSEFIGEVSLPTQAFVVYALGQDSIGQPFQRVIGSQITPQLVSIVPPSAVDLGRGQDTSYFFQVKNEGPSDTFSFSALDDRNYVTGVTPASATLATGATVNVKVVIQPASTSSAGTLDTLTFSAASTTQSDVSNSAILISRVVDPVILGDVNRDGLVNCEDLNLVKASFGKKVGQPAFNPAVDLDTNGIVDIRDLSVVARQVSAVTKCN